MAGKQHSKETKSKMSTSQGGTGIPYELYFYPEEFYIIRESIIIRDKCKCQNCKISRKMHIKKVGKDLTVHHIDYNKKNCKPKNLITLCINCNLHANKNRMFWIKIYIQKVKEILCQK